MEFTAQEVEIIKKETNFVITKADKFEVANQGDVDEANNILKGIATAINQVEIKRLSITRPLNQSLTEINKTFKGISGPLEKAKSVLKSKVMAWRIEENKRLLIEREKVIREEERRRKIQEAHEAKGHKVSAPVTLQKPSTRIQNDSTNTRKDWKFKVVDLNKVPVELMQTNDKLINELIQKGAREIPGLEIYQKEIMVIR